MASMRHARTMHLADAAYLAGLVDGEGTVTLTRRHRRENRRITVSISNTEIDLLLFAQRVTGVGLVTRKCRYSARHAPAYAWAAWGRQALDVLRQIQPWMKSYKAKRAELALAEYVALTPRNGKYTADARRARAIFETRLLDLTARRVQSGAIV